MVRSPRNRAHGVNERRWAAALARKPVAASLIAIIARLS
jgi:hypothetical protein